MCTLSYILQTQLILHRSAALLAIVILVCSHARSSAAKGFFDAAVDHRPVVGAIRWDGWIGSVAGYDVGVQVEKSLGPQRWHSRLPFFAEELSATAVRIRSNTQTVMDQEIGYAHRAGLAYWAFVMYPPDNPQTLDRKSTRLHSSQTVISYAV